MLSVSSKRAMRLEECTSQMWRMSSHVAAREVPEMRLTQVGTCKGQREGKWRGRGSGARSERHKKKWLQQKRIVQEKHRITGWMEKGEKNMHKQPAQTRVLSQDCIHHSTKCSSALRVSANS